MTIKTSNNLFTIHRPLTSVLCPLSSDTGFTLIELIMVIVILGIIGVMGANFISQAFKGFSDSDVRMEIYEQGKIALVRMEREIRNAIPNAVEVSDDYLPGTDSDTISFGAIDETITNDSGVFGQYTEEDPAGTASITDQAGGLPVATLVSIYNTGWSDFSGGSRIYSVTSNLANPMTLDGNIAEASPNQRFYAVDGNAIRYYISGGTLFRSTATVGTGGIGGFGNEKPLARNITQTDSLPFFAYSAGTLSRNSLVAINFSITERGQTISFHKEIHVRNVP